VSGDNPIGSMFHESGGLELTPEREAGFRLAVGVRRIIEELVSHPAPVGDLEEATTLVEQVADLLGRQLGPRGYGSWAESANAGTPYAFFDNSPIIGQANPLAPPADLHIEADRVVGSVVFGSAYEGPPGHCHGGYLAATFDELLGMAQTLSGQSGMTGTLTVRYRRPTPLHQRIDLEAELVKVDGRKVTVAGRSFCEGQLTAESEGIFISLDATRFSELLSSRREPGAENGA
jgi:acyl-coenzyme A thioesterase PaaI-like protein